MGIICISTPSVPIFFLFIFISKLCSKKENNEDLINLVSKNIPKRSRILDVGIGDGYPFASQLNKIGYQLYGIDLSPTHVAMVRKEFPNIIVDVGDAQSLKFPNKHSFFNMRKDLQYKIYGVEFDNPDTLVEIGKTNLTEFHRLVYKVFKKGKN